MPLTPEILYLQLGSLITEMPDLANGPITPEVNRWLGRVTALISQNDPFDTNIPVLRSSSQFLTVNRAFNAQAIAAIVHQAFAKAELAAPAAVQGTFIAVGHTFDAFAAVSKVLGTAKTDVLMIDPYADEKMLTDYAVLAPDQVIMRILTDAHYYYKPLRPAAEKWMQQFGSARPLAVRLTAPKSLHDRSILVDNATAWAVGQSFRVLAPLGVHVGRDRSGMKRFAAPCSLSPPSPIGLSPLRARPLEPRAVRGFSLGLSKEAERWRPG